MSVFASLQWCHNEPDGVSNHRPHDCLLNHLFRRKSKKTSMLRVTGLCEGNSPVTGEFPAQRASNADFFPIDDVIMCGLTVIVSMIHTLCIFFQSIKQSYFVGNFSDQHSFFFRYERLRVEHIYANPGIHWENNCWDRNVMMCQKLCQFYSVHEQHVNFLWMNITQQAFLIVGKMHWMFPFEIT